jgi:hypothetical protein
LTSKVERAREEGFKVAELRYNMKFQEIEKRQILHSTNLRDMDKDFLKDGIIKDLEDEINKLKMILSFSEWRHNLDKYKLKIKHTEEVDDLKNKLNKAIGQ